MNDFVEFFDARIIRSTEKAALCEIEEEQVWIPWSQIHEDSIDRDGETGTLIAAEWCAIQKGLI